jgi:hypothetical protein
MRKLLASLLVAGLLTQSFGSTVTMAQAVGSGVQNDPELVAALKARGYEAQRIEMQSRDIVGVFMSPDSQMTPTELMDRLKTSERSLVESATKVKTIVQRLLGEGKLTPERAAQLLMPARLPSAKPVNEGLDYSNPLDVHILVVRMIQRRQSEYLADIEAGLFRPAPGPRAEPQPSHNGSTLSPLWQVALASLFYGIANYRAPSERSRGGNSCYVFERWNGESCEVDFRMACDQVAMLDFVNAANCRPAW